MNRRRICLSTLVLIACCLFLVPARAVFADETMTHIEGTVSFDDDNNSRGLRPDSLTVLVGVGPKSKGIQMGDEFDPSTCEAVKACVVNADSNWTYSADVPSRDSYDNELVPVASFLFDSNTAKDNLPPYAVSKDGLNFNLLYRPLKFDIPVTIKWNDGNNADGTRPTSASFGVEGGSGGATTVWRAQGNNTDPVTDLSLSDMSLYTLSTVWVDFGSSHCIHKTFSKWTTYARIGGKELVLGSTVESDGYSYTMTEHIDKDNVPSYEIIAVHQPKASGGMDTGSGTETDNKPGSTIPDNQKPNDQVKPGSDEKKKDDKKDGKPASRPNQQNSALPKTGDSSIAAALLFVAAGAALTSLGLSLKRQ